MNLFELNVKATDLIGYDDGETYYLSEDTTGGNEHRIVSSEELSDFDFTCDFNQELVFDKTGIFNVDGLLNGEPDQLQFRAYFNKLITDAAND